MACRNSSSALNPAQNLNAHCQKCRNFTLIRKRTKGGWQKSQQLSEPDNWSVATATGDAQSNLISFIAGGGLGFSSSIASPMSKTRAYSSLVRYSTRNNAVLSALTNFLAKFCSRKKNHGYQRLMILLCKSMQVSTAPVTGEVCKELVKV